MAIVDVMYNMGLLVAVSLASGGIGARWRRRGAAELLDGLAFGTAAVMALQRPQSVLPGFVLDGQSVMLGLCAMFFGPMAAGLALLIAAGLRFLQGGPVVVTGILVLVWSVALGLLYFDRRHRERTETSPWDLLQFGIQLHVGVLLLAWTNGSVRVGELLARSGLLLIVLYPLATVVAGIILSDQQARLRASATGPVEDPRKRRTPKPSQGAALPASSGRLDQVLRWVSEEASPETAPRYESFLQAMQGGLITLDVVPGEDGGPSDYRIAAVNAAFERMSGRKADDLVSRSLREVLVEGELACLEHLDAVAQKGEPVRFEWRFRDAGGGVETTVFRPRRDHLACLVSLPQP